MLNDEDMLDILKEATETSYYTDAYYLAKASQIIRKAIVANEYDGFLKILIMIAKKNPFPICWSSSYI